MDKKEGKEVDLNVEELKLEDASFDVDLNLKDVKITPSNNENGEVLSSSNSEDLNSESSKNINDQVDNITDKTNDVHSNDRVENLEDKANNEQIKDDSNEIIENNSINDDLSDNESVSDDSIQNNNIDDRSLKEKIDDTKERLQDAKERIQNAPENIKNKIEDTKDKINDAKEKIQNAPEDIKNKINDAKDKINDTKEKVKNAPENIKNKANKAKDAWNNRPKNFKDFKDRAKNAGSNIKDKAKDRAKRAAENAKEKAKDKAQEAWDNSDLNKKLQDAKNKVDKAKKIAQNTKKAGKTAAKGAKIAGKAAANVARSLGSLFIQTLPWSAIAIFILIEIIVIIVVLMTFMPGSRGSVEGEDSKYSERDQQTLEDLKELYKKYPNADGSLAMSTVLYPYFSILHSGSVKRYIISNDELELSEEELEEESTDEETEDVVTDDDIYLYPFRVKKMRNKLETVLKALNGKDEESFKKYLKDEYFKSDKGFVIGYDKEIMDGYKGYKDMINNIDSDNEESFKEALINDIYSNKNYFVSYVFENAICSTTLVDAGNVTTDKLLNSPVYVDLKKPGCSQLAQCSESYYSEFLTMEEYAKGVVYEELGSETSDVEVLAAQMVAAKTFTIARRPSEVKYSEELQAYVIPMLWSTADQDFCHVEKGCNSSDITAHYGYNKPAGNTQELMHGANREPASADRKALLDQAWENSKSTYVVKSGSSGDNYAAAHTSYWQGGGCNVGNCMEQTELVKKSGTGMDHKSILSYFYSQYSLATIENEVSTLQTASAMVCTNNMTNFSAERNKISSLAITLSEQKIPYYIGGLASSKVLENNNFGSEIEADADGNTKKGLGEVGFVNFVFWNVIGENFGNTNDINKIISDDVSYSVTKEQLLIGDIGMSSDNSIIAVYIGEEKWAYADSISKNVVVTVDDRFVTYRRLQYFKNEIYNFSIRTTAPTPSEWIGKEWYLYSPRTTGQCPWYAKNRATEIIAELYANSSITKEKYNQLIKTIHSIYNAYNNGNDGGNGHDFTLDRLGYGPGVVKFTSGSYNITDVRAPAFMAHYSSTSPEYGHVVVIEYANPEEDIIKMTDGWKVKNPTKDISNCANDFSCVSFRPREMTYQEFYDNFSGIFKGFIFFME